LRVLLLRYFVDYMFSPLYSILLLLLLLSLSSFISNINIKTRRAGVRQPAPNLSCPEFRFRARSFISRAPARPVFKHDGPARELARRFPAHRILKADP